MTSLLVARLSKDEALQKVHEYGVFGYQPNEIGAGIFTAVYAICCFCLTYMAIKHKRWWMLATLSFGAGLECAGNAIRIHSHYNVLDVNAYIAQEVILVITPAFFAAAQFSILSKICLLFGPEYIRPFHPKWLIPFFVTLDVASMAVQGGGSGVAAISEINNDPLDTINGHGYVVVAGLAIQLVGYLAFNSLFALFVLRIRKNPPQGQRGEWWNKRMHRFLAATWLSALFIFLRSVFRTVEMGTGWIGPVSTTEWYYLVFDATFVSIALIILCVFSPASYMPRDPLHPNGKEEVLPSHNVSSGNTTRNNSLRPSTDLTDLKDPEKGQEKTIDS